MFRVATITIFGIATKYFVFKKKKKNMMVRGKNTIEGTGFDSLPRSKNFAHFCSLVLNSSENCLRNKKKLPLQSNNQTKFPFKNHQTCMH